MLLLVFSVFSLVLRFGACATIVVDGVSEWKNPTVLVGDSIVFRRKDQYNLYIFRNQNAFNLCNFTEATLLTKTNSSFYMWYPSRPGFYYFTFHNDSLNSCNEHSLKLPVQVIPAALSPATAELSPKAAPTPRPIAGGGVASSPAYQMPFQPRDKAYSPFPEASAPLKVPDGVPFINSNPAVPLPTDEVDSATIRPLPANGHQRQVAMGLFGVEVQVSVVSTMLLLLMV